MPLIAHLVTALHALVVVDTATKDDGTTAVKLKSFLHTSGGLIISAFLISSRVQCVLWLRKNVNGGPQNTVLLTIHLHELIKFCTILTLKEDFPDNSSKLFRLNRNA